MQLLLKYEILDTLSGGYLACNNSIGPALSYIIHSTVWLASHVSNHILKISWRSLRAHPCGVSTPVISSSQAGIMFLSKGTTPQEEEATLGDNRFIA
jgi:hypothetical protein